MASKLLVARSGGRVESLEVGALVADTLEVGGNAVTETSVLLGSSEAVDLNGEAAGIIFDADADTSMSAPTDDQIDIEIAGADDFTFTANTLTALSGSSIKTDVIGETTGAAGVTIDSVLCKDGAVTARNPVVAVTADGAISVPNGNTTYYITENSDGAAMTLVDPTAGTHDGLRLTFISTTAQAHSLDLVTGINGGAADVGTFAGAAGDGVTIEAYQGVWYEVPGANANVTWA